MDLLEPRPYENKPLLVDVEAIGRSEGVRLHPHAEDIQVRFWVIRPHALLLIVIFFNTSLVVAGGDGLVRAVLIICGPTDSGELHNV